jgi:hypothetical protein
MHQVKEFLLRRRQLLCRRSIGQVRPCPLVNTKTGLINGGEKRPDTGMTLTAAPALPSPPPGHYINSVKPPSMPVNDATSNLFLNGKRLSELSPMMPGVAAPAVTIKEAKLTKDE